MKIGQKSRQIRKKTLCRVNSIKKILPFALKMFLVIENHFGGAFEGGDLMQISVNFVAKYVTVGSALAGLSNNGNPSSLIMGIIIVIDQLCNNGEN